jgi:hypothetical protein
MPESACEICGRPDGAGHEPRCYPDSDALRRVQTLEILRLGKEPVLRYSDVLRVLTA